MMWDSTNIKNMWFAEMLLRRLQLLEHAASEGPNNPSYEGASHFMGSHETSAGGFVAPSLQTFVASELGKLGKSKAVGQSADVGIARDNNFINRHSVAGRTN